jgi:hypothetical protein
LIREEHLLLFLFLTKKIQKANQQTLFLRKKHLLQILHSYENFIWLFFKIKEIREKKPAFIKKCNLTRKRREFGEPIRAGMDNYFRSRATLGLNLWLAGHISVKKNINLNDIII